MADSKISNLTLVTTLDGADVLPIVNGGSTKKVTVTKIKEGLATTTYVDTQDALKVDKVDGKGLSTEDYTTTEKSKLAGIASGAEVNVNADWNAVSGDAQILNKPTIPTAVTQTSQLTNNGADGVNPFITALDIPTDGQASTLVREVKNMTGATLTKGTVVYISGANGNKALVSKALATTDALSSRTFGMLQSNILNNGLGNCVIIGDLSGVDTSSFTEGVQLYLSGVTAGTYTESKTLAPTHLVYVGKVTRSHPTQGQIEVGIQNGYELEEIHDVAINTQDLINGDVIVYESSTQLWKNKKLLVGDSDFGNDNNTYNSTLLSTLFFDLQIGLSGKLSISNWTNYSNISTILGWASFTQKTIKYLEIGKMAIVEYYISGVSNNTSTSFTLPQSSATVTGMIWANNNQTLNSATNYMGYGNIPSNSNVISFGYYPTGASITATWTATGTKTIRGMITFEIA
jgi:hypothetical protein